MTSPNALPNALQSIDILVTAPIRSGVTEALEATFTVHRLWEQDDPDAFFAAHGARIRGIATTTLFGKVRADLIERLPALEIIASFGVGYDNVDVAAAVQAGAIVTNTPGVLVDETADLALGLLLATIRQIPQAERHLRAGLWPQERFRLSPSLRGRRVGILGLGAIGKAIARRLEGFGVEIAYHGRTRQPGVDYPWYPDARALAQACDVLIVAAPGTAETDKMVDAAVLAALGPDGILVNIGRGSIVDEDALVAALANGTILAAGLDVYAHEPRVPEGLLAHPRSVLLPHVGSGSERTRAAMGALQVENLVRWFTDRAPVTPVPETAHLVPR
ncbi:2-hydroxyacid dehydrogenase [Novosphingobium sp. NBM11]|uniref:2-hydroxyacid dehydrogenase n=1 Tax=Novosphingobium sp. NBM11 TaxID=2596914 RepID=UPI0018926A41|nr:2-hydroxyacid dehydrogenase [Novosphingobium sp. NBM11]MBF5088663.1 2-hydroxyacid dehydrogenase [Novosphingobium sp. NBM11]